MNFLFLYLELLLNYWKLQWYRDSIPSGHFLAGVKGSCFVLNPSGLPQPQLLPVISQTCL